MENQKKKKRLTVQKKNQKWLTEDGLTLIRGWARDGLTNDEIASKMDISRDTLYIWQNDFKDFADALNQTKDYVDRQVEQVLLNKALSGDTTAMIFWLKNRKRDRWRDRTDINADVNQDVKISVKIDD